LKKCINLNILVKNRRHFCFASKFKCAALYGCCDLRKFAICSLHFESVYCNVNYSHVIYIYIYDFDLTSFLMFFKFLYKIRKAKGFPAENSTFRLHKGRASFLFAHQYKSRVKIFNWYALAGGFFFVPRPGPTLSSFAYRYRESSILFPTCYASGSSCCRPNQPDYSMAFPSLRENDQLMTKFHAAIHAPLYSHPNININIPSQCSPPNTSMNLKIRPENS
jgi:hypothetical protein